MSALFSVAQIRSIETEARATLPPGTLMRRAGQAAARAALELIGTRGHGPVLVLAGPGNNGGDALEVAANLSQAGVAVHVLHLDGHAPPAAETAQALERARASAAEFIGALPAEGEWSLIVDGLFGIGLARALEGQARQLAEAVNRLDGTPVLALDVPSGLDADSGAIVGPGGLAIRATHTITFIGDKPGLHTCEGREYAGDVLVAPLGIDPGLLPAGDAQLSCVKMFATQLKARGHNTHKGSYGDVAVIGGARGMAGAPVLAARAALYSGAGRVFIGALDPGPAFDGNQPELMFRDAAAIDMRSGALVLGPGMGDSMNAIGLLGKAIDSRCALVLDADALNLVAASPELQTRLTLRKGSCVLTPHPLEAARLLGVTSAQVQLGRLKAAREIAARLKAVVILKGSGSVIAAPQGGVAINPTGNPGLASAGTGDVLAGLCGSLLAQGWPDWETAVAAAWIHGAAADRLVAQGIGPTGLTASELPDAIRATLNQLNMPKA
jgi:hydroxyethylthiazole kinase-like uncharacterized protein yjeF